MNTTTAIDAAQSGSVLVFALSVSGIIIFIISSLLWWFIKERIKMRERETGLLDRRLSSGVERFNEIQKQITVTKDSFQQVVSSCVHKEQFEKYCIEHNDEHEKFERKLEEMRRGQHEIRAEINGLNEKVDSGFGRMTDLLSKLVEIKKNN